MIGYIRQYDYQSSMTIYNQLVASENLAETSQYMPSVKILLQCCMQLNVYCQWFFKKIEFREEKKKSIDSFFSFCSFENFLLCLCECVRDHTDVQCLESLTSLFFYFIRERSGSKTLIYYYHYLFWTLCFLFASSFVFIGLKNILSKIFCSVWIHWLIIWTVREKAFLRWTDHNWHYMSH